MKASLQEVISAVVPEIETGRLSILGAAIAISLIFYVLTSKKQRQLLANGLRLRTRRISSAITPPRSLSPAKKHEKKNSVDNYSATLYKDVFPPSRREAFALIHDTLPASLKAKSIEQLIEPLQDPGSTCIPLATPFDDLEGHMTTPTGFTVDEVRQFGDFPDYAALSGIPLPMAYHEFDVTRALPRPYRPFRWAYHQTMSLTKMESDWWLELDKDYEARLKQRNEIHKNHSKLVLQYLPGSELACKELMEMVLEFLCVRYPHYFSLDKIDMIFHNNILKTATDLKTTQPMHVILENIPEDFGIMLRDPEDGSYRLRSALICSSLGWNVDTKIGLKLHEIHGPVPDYKEKMQYSMDRYFAKKPTDKSIQRGSWGVEVDQPLFMPPGDPHEKLRDHQPEDLELSRCHLRVDWQTLRRLPLSGAVVFNFKALFTPVEVFRDEPFIPALLLRNLDSMKTNLKEYKSTWHNDHIVKPALQKWADEQVEKGWVPADWEPHTLQEAPFYPGWEKKWRDEQGF